MKRIFAAILAFALAFALCACGTAGTTSLPEPEAPASQPESTAPPPESAAPAEPESSAPAGGEPSEEEPADTDIALLDYSRWQRHEATVGEVSFSLLLPEGMKPDGASSDYALSIIIDPTEGWNDLYGISGDVTKVGNIYYTDIAYLPQLQEDGTLFSSDEIMGDVTYQPSDELHPGEAYYYYFGSWTVYTTPPDGISMGDWVYYVDETGLMLDMADVYRDTPLADRALLKEYFEAIAASVEYQ